MIEMKKDSKNINIISIKHYFTLISFIKFSYYVISNILHASNTIFTFKILSKLKDILHIMHVWNVFEVSIMEIINNLKLYFHEVFPGYFHVCEIIFAFISIIEVIK